MEEPDVRAGGAAAAGREVELLVSPARSLPQVLRLVHRPHRAALVLNPHKVFVQRQVVPDRILQGSKTSIKEEKNILKIKF